MRKINVSKIRDTVYTLCLKANFELRGDILGAIKKAARRETDRRARNILGSIIENAAIARRKKLAICQDTGMAVVMLEAGQDVAFTGGDLYKAIEAGVRDAYKDGYLRKSVVGDPITRKNTMTNTPPIIHINIVKGSRVKIAVTPKGFGSENKSVIKMFNPTVSMDVIKGFIIDAALRAGPGACPPLVVGVGIGGTFEKCALLAKKALLRPISKRNPKRHVAALEREILNKINRLGSGAMGLGGKTTALGLNIETFPTHIAALPVAVNISCHATRGAEKTI